MPKTRWIPFFTPIRDRMLTYAYTTPVTNAIWPVERQASVLTNGVKVDFESKVGITFAVVPYFEGDFFKGTIVAEYGHIDSVKNWPGGVYAMLDFECSWFFSEGDVDKNYHNRFIFDTSKFFVGDTGRDPDVSIVDGNGSIMRFLYRNIGFLVWWAKENPPKITLNFDFSVLSGVNTRRCLFSATARVESSQLRVRKPPLVNLFGDEEVEEEPSVPVLSPSSDEDDFLVYDFGHFGGFSP